MVVIMKPNTMTVLHFLLAFALTASTAFAQTATGTSAPATEARASSGRPSTIQIRQQFLKQQQAAIQSELREVQRCIKNSRLFVVLIDQQGRINRVPQTDLVNCSRRLAQLQRQILSLARKAEDLARDAQYKAMLLEDALREEERAAKLRALQGTAGGME